MKFYEVTIKNYSGNSVLHVVARNATAACQLATVSNRKQRGGEVVALRLAADIQRMGR